MCDYLILLLGWGLGSVLLELLCDVLYECELYLNVLIELLLLLDDVVDWFDEFDDNLLCDSWLVGWLLGGMFVGELVVCCGDDCWGLLILVSNLCFCVCEDWLNVMLVEIFEDFFEVFLFELYLICKCFILLVSQGVCDFWILVW